MDVLRDVVSFFCYFFLHTVFGIFLMSFSISFFVINFFCEIWRDIKEVPDEII